MKLLAAVIAIILPVSAACAAEAGIGLCGMTYGYFTGAFAKAVRPQKECRPLTVRYFSVLRFALDENANARG